MHPALYLLAAIALLLYVRNVWLHYAVERWNVLASYYLASKYADNVDEAKRLILEKGRLRFGLLPMLFDLPHWDLSRYMVDGEWYNEVVAGALVLGDKHAAELAKVPVMTDEQFFEELSVEEKELERRLHETEEEATKPTDEEGPK